MSLRTVHVDRYIIPLREGGSLPAIVEADDEGLYVLKFRGAGQGKKVMIAELVAGEFGRAAKLTVPELVFAELDPELGRSEPDPEVQSLIRASGGLNIAMDYLPGSLTFDPVSRSIDSAIASRVVWFDAFISNVDRSVRNTNMLIWHKNLWLIDHGASMIFHYDWSRIADKAASPFTHIKDHVLLRFAKDIPAADIEMRKHITESEIKRIMNLIPTDWLEGDANFENVEDHRQAYIKYFTERLKFADNFVQEAVRASSNRL